MGGQGPERERHCWLVCVCGRVWLEVGGLALSPGGGKTGSYSESYAVFILIGGHLLISGYPIFSWWRLLRCFIRAPLLCFPYANYLPDDATCTFCLV